MKDILLFAIQDGKVVFDPKELPGQLTAGLDRLKTNWETLDKSKMRPWEVTVVDAALNPQDLKLKPGRELVDHTQNAQWWSPRFALELSSPLRLEVKAPVDAVTSVHPEQRKRLMLATVRYDPSQIIPSDGELGSKISQDQLPEELADIVFRPRTLQLRLSWDPLNKIGEFSRPQNPKHSPLVDRPVHNATLYHVDFDLGWLREDSDRTGVPVERGTWIRIPRVGAGAGSVGQQLIGRESIPAGQQWLQNMQALG